MDKTLSTVTHECKKIWSTYYTQRKIKEHKLLNTKPRHAVIIILDGVSRIALEKSKTPIIDNLIKEGVYADKCFTVFPSVTPVTHVSLVTGAYPENTGYMVWSFREHLLYANMANKAETLTEVVNKAGYTSAAVCEASARSANISISETICGSDMEETTKITNYIFKKYKPNLINITYYCTDDISEKFGPCSNEALSTIECADSCIGKIRECLKGLGILQETLFIITSDHGMTNINELFPREKISKVVKKMRIHRAIHHAKTIHFCYKEEEKIENEIIKKACKLDGVKYLFTRPELVLLGSDTPKIGNSVLAMNENFCLSLHEKGGHGGYTDTEMNVPLILSGCGINRSSKIKFARTIDIAPTVAFLLGVPHPKNADGRILIEALDGQFELKNMNQIDQIREKMHNVIEEINKIKNFFATGKITVKEYEDEKIRILNEVYMLRNQEKRLTRCCINEACNG
jgi:hypothetical protein